MRSDEELEVLLGSTHVGFLRRTADDGIEFSFSRQYLDAPRRPVLGQRFLDRLEEVHRSRIKLPRFFSHLLPEGPLRRMVAKQLDVHRDHEFAMIAWLGEDLPGNVRIRRISEVDPQIGDPEHPVEVRGSGPLKFSLAGMQLKFSAMRDDRGLTIPASGAGGNWIVKLPHGKYQGVPENEALVMEWARRAGLDTPDSYLVPVSEVRGLPDEARQHTGNALAVRRFDRAEGRRRIHMEDFAQVLGTKREEGDKYKGANYETLANVILAVAGDEALDEYLRRLVFMVLSGNGDAHLKNWSLLYPDGVHAALSPAYDLVFTVFYMPSEKLALNLGRTKSFGEIVPESFARLASAVGRDPVAVTELVADFVDRVYEAWSRMRVEREADDGLLKSLQQHLDSLPLVRKRA